MNELNNTLSDLQKTFLSPNFFLKLVSLPYKFENDTFYRISKNYLVKSRNTQLTELSLIKGKILMYKGFLIYKNL